MKTALAPYQALIRERCGLLIQGSREDVLSQAIPARAQTLGIAPEDYFGRLSASQEEFQTLVNLLTINETYFFREPEQIRLLVDTLAPRYLAARPSGRPVRILSAGCSSGEEPYSLVMALMERYGPRVAELFTFVAADIDSLVLAKAREARYLEFSFRNMPASLRARYFDRDGQAGLLKKQVKDLVCFQQANFRERVQPSLLCGCDIIFFRNVSIYFDTPTRQAVQHNLASLLSDNGSLFFGTAETLANDLGVLALIQEGGLFYFVKEATASSPPACREEAVLDDGDTARAATRPDQPPLTPVSAPRAAVPPDKEAPPMASSPVAADIATARRHLDEKRHGAALGRLDAILAVAPTHTEAAVLRAYALACLKDFTGAAAQALRILEAEAWSVDAFMLLGLAAKWDGRSEEAIRWFKQAVYTKPECWPAHYHLADLYRQRGETAPSQRAYRVVLQLACDARDVHGVQYLPLDLPVGEIRFLCRHQLAKLPPENGVPGPR